MLKKSRRCPNCGGDTLRDLLTSTTPPMTSEEEDFSSSGPESPLSGLDSPAESKSSNKSPIALFAIAAGLFLINPVSFSSPGNHNQAGSPHSRVERSVDAIEGAATGGKAPIDFMTLWGPRIFALGVNLILFLAVYFLSSKVGNLSRKYSNDKLKVLRSYMSTFQNSPPASAASSAALVKHNLEKKRELEIVLGQFNSMPTGWISKFGLTLLALMRLPLSLVQVGSKSKREVREEIAKLYIEYGKLSGYNIFAAIRALNYCSANDEIVISSIILSKSKLLFRFVLMFRNLKNHTLGTAEGLTFLKNNIRKPLPASTSESILATTTNVPKISIETSNAALYVNNDVNQLLCKFKETMLTRGIMDVFLTGNGRDFFKIALEAANKGQDKVCQFWGAVMWTETEWIRAGGRVEVLEKLYKLIDTTWKHNQRLYGENNALMNAAYFAHLAKRSQLNGAPCKKVLEFAGTYLRDSINTAPEKPKKVMQLVWCLIAEWILETRLALWEDTKDKEGFAKDLDTLRSLTHYVPVIILLH